MTAATAPAPSNQRADTSRRDDTRHVGFIGLGDQGLPMAIAVAEAGFTLHVWARRPASVERLGDTPVIVHDTPAELGAACDVVAVCVSTDEDLLRLLTGGSDDGDGEGSDGGSGEGLLAAMRPGTVVVNHGTGTPRSSQHLAEICTAAAVRYVDAPVSGGRPGAEARTLTVLAGGEKEAVEHCRAIFAAFATHVVAMGPVGTGQAAKLFNNALLILNQAAIAEIVRLASAAGTDPDCLVEALRLGSANSRALTLLGEMVNPDTVRHLSAVEDLDIDLFATAMAEAGLNADDVVARAHEGARGLPALVASLPQAASARKRSKA